jgi:hypothetical protein
MKKYDRRDSWATLSETLAGALNHKWYMEARLVTLNDEYSSNPNAKVSVEPFTDIIG